MNFTREIKRELVKIVPPAREDMLSLFCGALDAGGGIPASGNGKGAGFSFTLESEEIAAYLVALSERLFGVEMSLREVVRGGRQGRDKLTFAYTGTGGEELAEKISAFGGKDRSGTNPESYLKGAFLGGGSCTLPKEGKKTGYHLEIVFADKERAEGCLSLLDRVQLLGNIVQRNGRSVVYTKSREAISDFLAVLGAKGAVRILGSVAAAREENNLENRKENCYAGNADKAAIASAKHILQLEKLKKEGKLDDLAPALLETARARIENPELSLSELAEKLLISKSCLYHRLKKLLAMGAREDR